MLPCLLNFFRCVAVYNISRCEGRRGGGSEGKKVEISEERRMQRDERSSKWMRGKRGEVEAG